MDVTFFRSCDNCGNDIQNNDDILCPNCKPKKENKPMTDKTPLPAIHTDFDSAYIVENYPYGGLRTQMKFWIETKAGKGQRVVSCSLNPKTDKWNKPHVGTYNTMKVLFIDNSSGHVENSGIHEYNALSGSTQFLADYGEALTEEQKNRLIVWSVSNDVQKNQGIRMLDNGRLAFYTALNNSLRAIGRADLVKKITLKNNETGEITVIE
jgi:hypothetical protein